MLSFSWLRKRVYALFIITEGVCVCSLFFLSESLWVLRIKVDFFSVCWLMMTMMSISSVLVPLQ